MKKDETPPYSIEKYSFDKAKSLNVRIYPSFHRNKKIDVYSYDGTKLICSIGDVRFSDYPHLIKTHGLAYATERRGLYHLRHNRKSPAEFYASHILW
jgi:hypothetical protein